MSFYIGKRNQNMSLDNIIHISRGNQSLSAMSGPPHSNTWLHSDYGLVQTNEVNFTIINNNLTSILSPYYDPYLAQTVYRYYAPYSPLRTSSSVGTGISFANYGICIKITSIQDSPFDINRYIESDYYSFIATNNNGSLCQKCSKHNFIYLRKPSNNSLNDMSTEYNKEEFPYVGIFTELSYGEDSTNPNEALYESIRISEISKLYIISEFSPSNFSRTGIVINNSEFKIGEFDIYKTPYFQKSGSQIIFKPSGLKSSDNIKITTTPEFSISNGSSIILDSSRTLLQVTNVNGFSYGPYYMTKNTSSGGINNRVVTGVNISSDKLYKLEIRILDAMYGKGTIDYWFYGSWINDPLYDPNKYNYTFKYLHLLGMSGSSVNDFRHNLVLYYDALLNTIEFRTTWILSYALSRVLYGVYISEGLEFTIKEFSFAQ